MKSEEQILTIVKRNIAEFHLSALLGCDKELRLTVCILDREARRWQKIGDVVKLVQKRLPRSVRSIVS